MANAWARRVDEGESAKAHAALMAYLEYGPQRSLAKIVQVHNKSIATLGKWSTEWQWVERAQAYDAEQQRLTEDARAAERAKIMAFRYANDYERVKALDEMTQYLIDMSKDATNVWLRTTRTFGQGLQARTEEEEKFNAPLFDQIRGGLMDIAKHKGELTQRQEIGGTNGSSEIVIRYVDDWRTPHGNTPSDTTPE